MVWGRMIRCRRNGVYSTLTLNKVNGMGWWNVFDGSTKLAFIKKTLHPDKEVKSLLPNKRVIYIFFLFPLKILERIDKPHYERPPRPDHCPANIFAIIQDLCWRDNPDDRGHFSTLEKRVLTVRMRTYLFQL